MRFVLAFIITSLSATGSALAGELPPQPAYDWTGVYVGGHLGDSWQTTSFSDPDVWAPLVNCCEFVNFLNDPTAATDANGKSFLHGIQAGWMYQVGRLVAGADFDFSWMRISGGGSSTFPTIPSFDTLINETYRVQTNWTATATATLGVAHDRWLVYGKAGAAWADEAYMLGLTGSLGIDPFAFSSSASHILTGWTTGLGIKYAISDNVFINAEYDFLDFGSQAQHFNGTFSATPAFTVNSAATFSPTFYQNISEVKVGLNYKLGAGPGLAAPSTSSPAYNWSGFYIGGHLGAGWQNIGFADPTESSVLLNCCALLPVTQPTAPTDAGGHGFLGGAQAGWMYQVGNLVVGAAADWSATNMQGRGGSSYADGVANENYSVRTNWTATTTATVGFAKDLWMLYTKAGVAWADDTYGLTVAGNDHVFVSTPFSFAASTNQIVTGWTVGLGLNLAISDHLFLNAEYDLLDFGSSVQHLSGALSATYTPEVLTPPVGTAATFDPSVSQLVQEFKVGLSYKFAPGGFIDGGGTAVSPLALKAPRTIAEYDWSGMFVGAHVGGGWQNVAFSDPSAFPVLTECCTSLSSTENPAAASNATGGGVLGGVQAGWMYQIRRLVVGGEFDFSGSGIKGGGNNSLAALPGTAFFANEAYSVTTNWTATSAATIGFAKDNWLIYTKAGAAWADNRYALDVTGVGGFYFNPPPVPFSFAASTNKIVPGWTAGLGVKWAISHDLFLDAEYDMLDFGSGVQHISGVFTATPTGTFMSGAGFSRNGTFDPVFNQIISEFKLGLNYKFSSMWPSP